MILSYCRKCGLYFTVADEFAGGAGSCPRCRISLRIPSPIPADSPHYVANLRYLARVTGTAEADGLPPIATSNLGPSCRYECPHCGEKYESLRAADYHQGTCPKCGAINMPTGDEVVFPRKYCTPENGTKPLEMEGEFLLANPSIDQTPGDSIIEGVIISDESSNEDTENTAADDKTDKSAAETSDNGSPAPQPPAAAARRSSSAANKQSKNHKWLYLSKGKPTGPVSAGQLLQLQRDGKINPSTPIRQEGMDRWMPIDNFPQLIYTPARPTRKPDTKPPITLHQPPRSFSILRRYKYVFAAAAVIALVAGILALQNPQIPQENESTKHLQWSVQRAENVARLFTNFSELSAFSAFSAKSLRQSHNLVKWNEFRFNGKDIGKLCREADSPAEKNKIIASVFLAFNDAMKSPPQIPPNPAAKSKNKTTNDIPIPKAGKPSVKSSVKNSVEKSVEKSEKDVAAKPEIPRLTNWRLVSNNSCQTVVEGINSINKSRFIFTFDVGMLIRLEIRS